MKTDVLKKGLELALLVVARWCSGTGGGGEGSLQWTIRGVRAPSGKGTLLTLELYKRVRISRVEV